MRILKNKTFQSYLMLFIGLMAIEVVFRILSGFTIFNFSLFRVIISSVIFTVIIGNFTSLLKPKKMFIFNFLFLIFASFYAFMQLTFFAHMGVYMSVSASSQLGAVTSYIGEYIEAIKPEFYLMFLPIGIMLLFILSLSFIKKRKPDVFKLKRTFRYQNTIMLLSSLIILLVCSFSYYIFLDDKYIEDEYQAVSNVDLFLSGANSGLCIKEFGVLSYGLIDVKAKYYPSYDTTLTFAYNNGNVKLETEDKVRKFDDSAWEELINRETNEIYNNLNRYFINNLITSKNEYTGLFKDKNLIVIMMESVNDLIYNKEYFPNFYNMATNGWYFTNNYSPRNTCPTGNNEMSSMIGLYSITNECTANINANNEYFEAIFNLFKNEGYHTNSFHNYGEYYYDRSIYHPNMGSEKYQDAEDMGIWWDHDYGRWASDEDLIDYYLNDLDNNADQGKFMSYLITVSSHRPYNDTELGNMHLDMTENTDYPLELRRYFSKLKVVDDALGALVDGLEQRGILDDTVIVLWGDHYPYGLSNETLSYALDRDLEDYENERVPLVIYNPQIESKQVEKYNTYINLTPTLANLFDLNYDPRYYVGADVFSEEYEDIVVFADLSWKNSIAYYNATTGEVKYYTDKQYTVEEIRNINNMVYSKYNASVLAIRYNYFKYLHDNLQIDDAEGILN